MTGQHLVDIVVKDGRVFFPKSDLIGSIAIEDGKIVAFGKSSRMPKANRVVDASGKIVIPGGIDAHVHVGQPWEGTKKPPYYEEDVQCATMAAAMAGTTTICDMPDSMPLVTNELVFRKKISFWSKRAFVDFGLHGGFIPNTNFDDLLPPLWNAGPTALKTFMCFSEDIWPAMDDGQLFDALEVIHQLDAFAILHAENDQMLTQNKRKLDEAGRTDFKSHLEWRPPIVEYEADARAALLLRESGAKGLIVHTSVPEGVKEIAAARRKGQKIYVETTPHYLYLTDKDLERRGPWVKCSPPLRDKARVIEIRKQLARGYIDTVGSDHSPFSKEEVERGDGNIWKAEAGMPGVETCLPLLLNGVSEGWLSLNRVVSCASENPARVFGLYPRKGAVRVGSDADLVVVDMKKKWRVKDEDLKMKCGWSPFNGKLLTGVPIMTIVRGEVVMEARNIVGREGYGKFIARSKN
jgi:D-hydantoinase